METGKPGRRWIDYLALFFSFIGGIIAVSLPWVIGLTQASSFGGSVWPLPGLVLVDWGVLGVLGLVAALLVVWKLDPKWLTLCWIATGGFVPLIIIGAFSIGPLVLISYVLFLAATIMLALRRTPSWLKSFGWFMLGLGGNLLIVLGLISLGNLGN